MTSGDSPEKPTGGTELNPTKQRALLVQQRARESIARYCADALKTKGYEVEQEGESIRGTPELERLAVIIIQSPEVQALTSALAGVGEVPITTGLWDDETRRRVDTLYYDNHARFQAENEAAEDFFGIGSDSALVKAHNQDIQDRVDNFHAMADLIRGDLKPLTPNDEPPLIAKVVDKVLSTKR